MVQTRTYALIVVPQEGGYLAYFPDLPGCHTWGTTYEAAVKNAEEALAVYVETLQARGDARRAALEAGEASGPAVPLDIDAFLEAQRASRR